MSVRREEAALDCGRRAEALYCNLFTGAFGIPTVITPLADVDAARKPVNTH